MRFGISLRKSAFYIPDCLLYFPPQEGAKSTTGLSRSNFNFAIIFCRSIFPLMRASILGYPPNNQFLNWGFRAFILRWKTGPG